MPRLNTVIAECKIHFVGFVMQYEGDSISNQPDLILTD